MKKYFWLSFYLVIGSFLMQGFQCASPEFTTGKLAYKNREYDKAEVQFEKELSKNPQNVEAWIMLSEVRKEKGDIKGAIDAVMQTDKYTTDVKLKRQAAGLKNSLWTKAYNDAIGKYNSYISDKDAAHLHQALELIGYAKILKPDMASFYNLEGTVYELLEDKDKAITAYSKYIDLTKKELDLAKEKGIHVNQNREEVIKALGQPVFTIGYRANAESDSVITDEFKVDNKEVYVFTYEKDNTFVTYGWTVDPPKHWEEYERSMPQTVSLSPYASLAQIYYDRKDYGRSLNNTMNILVLDPANVDANAFLVGIYEAQNNMDEAVKYIKGMVDRDPKNEVFRAQYGTILLKMERFDEAIKQYEEALRINPKYSEVMINIGAAYKNMALKIQKQQEEKAANDKSYVPDTKEYFPILEKSAQYYEQGRKDPKNLANPNTSTNILSDLANIYDVLDRKKELLTTLSELEAMEYSVGEDRKESYYLNLLRIYERLKKEEKSAEIQQKLNDLKR